VCLHLLLFPDRLSNKRFSSQLQGCFSLRQSGVTRFCAMRTKSTSPFPVHVRGRAKMVQISYEAEVMRGWNVRIAMIVQLLAENAALETQKPLGCCPSGFCAL
jgi:hypothetical protein